MLDIREIHDLYEDDPWRVYSERFRKLKESFQLPWRKIVDKLYTKEANLCNNRDLSNVRPQPFLRTSSHSGFQSKHQF